MKVPVYRIELDKEGNLWVAREAVNAMIRQLCPFSNNTDERVFCGVWCPLCSDIQRDEVSGMPAITICQDRVLVTAEGSEDV